jgi:hypothetical protein
MKNVLAYSIFLIMTLFIVVSAGLIVRASVVDKHSLVHFVQDYGTTPESNIALAQGSGNPATQPVLGHFPEIRASVSLSETCSKLLKVRTAAYRGSVVNYLHENGRPYSFSERQRLAHELGIADYHGTEQQNEILLQKLFVRFNEIPSQGCLAIKGI